MTLLVPPRPAGSDAPAAPPSPRRLPGLDALPVPARQGAAWLAGTTRRKAFRTYRVRLAVQAGFALTCVLLGWQFARFVRALGAPGGGPLPVRPPGVEGFLPISGLMGALEWLYAGSLNSVHPAATVLLLLFLLLAVVFRKSFCSWICPVGLLSDTLGRLSRRMFPRKQVSYVGAALDAGGRKLGLKRFRLSRAFDVPLRSLKYLLLGFFLWHILPMDLLELRAFIHTPYNYMSDVKMYAFFAEPGRITIVVLILLTALSILVQGAWCRFLCPYGALLGLFSWLSPVKVRRNAATCTDCGICDRVCTARLPVSKKAAITSAECTGCLDCVASCPVKDTLSVGTPRFRIDPLTYGAALLLLFGIGYGAARVAGLWHNDITPHEYRMLHRDVHRLGHP